MGDLGWLVALLFLILLLTGIRDNRKMRKKIIRLEEGNDRLIVALKKATDMMKMSIQSMTRAGAVIDEHLHPNDPRPEDFDK